MTDGAKSVNCSNCGHSFADSVVAMREPRLACPGCASTARTVHVALFDTVTVHESIAMKGRAAGGGRPFLEQVHEKLELFRKLGRWHLVTRVIDRRNDRYEEVILDKETGEVVREVREPLSQHRGRGAARRP